MWAHYRRFAIYNQIFVAVACVTAYYACVTAYYLLRMSLPAVVVLFVIMQAGALLGAWWSASQERGRQDRQVESLSLERK